MLGPAKTYKLGLSQASARTPTLKTVKGMGAIQRGFLQFKTQRAQRGISMPRGKNCRETIFAAQLLRNYPHRGGNFERGKIALSCGGEAIWEAF